MGRVEHFEGVVRTVRGMGRVEHFEGAVRAVRGMGRALLYGERLGYAEPGGRFAKQGVQAWGFS